MECFKIENLSFTYPNRERKTLDNINLKIEQGEFVTLCGKSGCGKTTLLRMLKTVLTPSGTLSGNIYFGSKPLSLTDSLEQSARIGFVTQSPDAQIVTDKVWHELAFGLESLGYSTCEIRTRVSEMASFFGINTWFYKNTSELSGGQKQLLNLASVMVMSPSVLILDEPTSQLDPISSQEFLKTLDKINKELGTTVILTEHRLEDSFSMSDRLIVMDDGKIIADGTPQEICDILKRLNHEMFMALPSPARIYSAVEKGSDYPLNVRKGKVWFENYSQNHSLKSELIPKSNKDEKTITPLIEMKDVWFRYEKNLPDVIKGLNVTIKKGELFAIVGGNASGKTTALSLISGLNTPYRGKVLINGCDIKNIKNLYRDILALLPQNPQSVFSKKTVYLDLLEILSDMKISDAEKDEKIKNVSALCKIDNLLFSHPYDLSGGEQQRAALAKVLLKSPQILLLDEPTKGMDAHFKQKFAEILSDLKQNGTTIIMVSHDIEFCAEYADTCALFFDGNITSSGKPREFFAGKSFYTTSANRMARSVLPNAVLANDVILACGGEIPPKAKKKINTDLKPDEVLPEQNTKARKKSSFLRIFTGCIFAILYLLTTISYITDTDILHLSQLGITNSLLLSVINILEVIAVVLCFSPPRKEKQIKNTKPKNQKKISKRTVLSAFFVLIAIPLTILFGMFFLGDRKYYFISLLIIIETIIPFCLIFENRKPQARELVIISVLCVLAVTSRAAFITLPQFKPVIAIIIISGICFGGETGFLVGAVTAFVSNLLFGQGPWTPWQMFSLGIIGFLSGITFRTEFTGENKPLLCIFGFFATFVLYGVIMNISSVITTQANPNMQMIKVALISGVPFDLIHAAATAFFLWFIAEPIIEKLERVKIKYGLINNT